MNLLNACKNKQSIHMGTNTTFYSEEFKILQKRNIGRVHSFSTYTKFSEIPCEMS